MFKNASTNSPAGAGRRLRMSLLAVGLAIGVHAALHSFLPKQFPFLPFAAAVLVACRWAGSAGGLLATMASAFVLRFWFLPPAISFIDERGLGLGLFLAAGLCVSWQTLSREKLGRHVEVATTMTTTTTVKTPPPPQPSDRELAPFEVAGSDLTRRAA
jgi:K+-sensing histidine kinase KdpD